MSPNPQINFGRFVPQCKGKDLSAVAPSKLLSDGWHMSVKVDGVYTQVHKQGDQVWFFSSGGKQFYLPTIADALRKIPRDFIIDTEFTFGCHGFLGERGQSTGAQTNFRSCFAKGIPINDSKVNLIVFNALRLGDKTEITYSHFLAFAKKHLCHPQCSQGHFSAIPSSLSLCLEEAELTRARGNEGLFLYHKSHVQRVGKTVNTAIKLKVRPTADLLCVDINDGKGKHFGRIGSLVLQDRNGLLVSVGTGLSDAQREAEPNTYLGKIIEIQYEQLLDTYIQPTFLQIREDKTAKENNHD